MDSDLVKAVHAFVEYLFRTLGPDRTLLFVFGLAVLLLFRRLYLDWRASKLINDALVEKERTIQRISQQERQWRAYFLQIYGGLTASQVERIVFENEFPRELEEPVPPEEESDTMATQKGKKRKKRGASDER